MQLKVFYFGYRLECRGVIKTGKVQAKAFLLETAIDDALEQVRRVFNSAVRVEDGDIVTCTLTNLETQHSGYYTGELNTKWGRG